MKVFIVRNLENPISVKYSTECAASCDSVGVKYEFYEGSWGRTLEELRKDYNYTYLPYTDPFSYEGKLSNNICNHLKLMKMSVDLNEPIVLLEHDILVKQDFTDFTIELGDTSIYYLSCSVQNREDYNYPKGSPVKLNKVNYYDGNKAKILTPAFSKGFLDFKKNNPDESSWKIYYKTINQYVLDPIPTVCESTNRYSTITNTKMGVLNEFLPKSFFDNLKSEQLKQYYIDSIKQCYKVPYNYATYMEMKS